MRMAGDGTFAATDGVAPCRLARKPKDVSVVAASLVVQFEGMHGVTRSLREMVMLLHGDGSRKCVDVRKVRPAFTHIYIAAL